MLFETGLKIAVGVLKVGFVKKHFFIRILVPMLYLKLYIASVRRRPPPPPSVRPVRPSPSSVVVVLCPSVRPVRPSSSVVVAYLQIEGHTQIFGKFIKI